VYKIRDNKFPSPRTGIEKQEAVNHRGRGVSSPRYLEWEEKQEREGKELGASIWGKERESGFPWWFFSCPLPTPTKLLT